MAVPEVEVEVDDAGPERAIEGDLYQPIGIIHAASGAGGQYVCIGSFLPTKDPASELAPVMALGPIGVPDPDKPTDPALFHPFHYGDAPVAPMGLVVKDMFNATTAVAWRVPETPRIAPEKCGETWKDVRLDPSRWAAVRPKTVTLAEGVVIVFATDAVVPAVIESTTPASVEGKPLIAIRTIDVSTMKPAMRDVSIGGHTLATGSVFGRVTDAIVPASIAMGDPEFKVSTFARPLSSVSSFTDETTLKAGHARTLVWFGSPEIATGDGSLRAIWISDR